MKNLVCKLTTKSYLTQVSEGSEKYEMYAELKDALSVFNMRKPIILKRKNPVYIDAQSQPDEVSAWLKEKNFNERICEIMKGMTGGEMFKLQLPQLEIICGSVEGKRLYNQLSLQRNLSKYKTTRGLELEEKLAKRRQQFEQ